MNPNSDKKEMTIAIVILVLAVAVVALVAVVPTTPGHPGNPNNPAADAQPIPKFSSCSALKASFEEARQNERNYGFGMEKMLTGMPMAAQSTGSSADGSSNQGPAYSTTNVQVEGVDEADIVKTNGEYIYTLTEGALTISKAYPAQEAGLVSYTPLNEENEINAENQGYSGMQPQEMFLDGEFVLIFGNQWMNIFPEPLENTNAGSGSGMMPPRYYSGNSVTVMQLWNVSDKTSPRLVKTAELEGEYVSSRKIGSTAFFVISTSPQRIWTENVLQEQMLPQYREKTGTLSTDDIFKPSCGCADVGYLEPTQPESFITIGSLEMTNPKAEIKKQIIVGSGENVYASLNNLYVAQSSYNYPKLFPIPMVREITRGIFEIANPEPAETTTVHKFSLANNTVSYLGLMQAPGHILNQFSMDKFDNHFRIATTIGEVWNTQKKSTNNIFIFDSELKKTGSLEDLAPGEKIYSARFMGARGYLVTFKKVDPFFVIDLSNPSSPQVLGKLKIPGYSDYLHPFDETHIIGVGKNTIEASDELVGQRGLDFAWYQGIKIALFDVTDVANPKEMYKVDIGDRGTDSPALHDHKAFLFDKEKQLLAIPITLAEISSEQKQGADNSNYPLYGEFTFQGAYVYNLSLENGFQLKGKITHDSGGENALKSGYYYSGNIGILRSLYIGNVLYTVSDAKILANDLATLGELKEIKLEPKA
ncbi:MAG: beta-propeller domain-containing protein [Candidatus Micrarchaeota archaeon]